MLCIQNWSHLNAKHRHNFVVVLISCYDFEKENNKTKIKNTFTKREISFIAYHISITSVIKSRYIR